MARPKQPREVLNRKKNLREAKSSLERAVKAVQKIGFKNLSDVERNKIDKVGGKLIEVHYYFEKKIVALKNKKK